MEASKVALSLPSCWVPTGRKAKLEATVLGFYDCPPPPCSSCSSPTQWVRLQNPDPGVNTKCFSTGSRMAITCHWHQDFNHYYSMKIFCLRQSTKMITRKCRKMRYDFKWEAKFRALWKWTCWRKPEKSQDFGHKKKIHLHPTLAAGLMEKRRQDTSCCTHGTTLNVVLELFCHWILRGYWSMSDPDRLWNPEVLQVSMMTH